MNEYKNKEGNKQNYKDNNIKYIKKENDNFPNQIDFISPKKLNKKKKIAEEIKRQHSLLVNNTNSLMNKKQELFGSTKFIDLNLVKYLDKNNKKYMEQISILNKNNKYRDLNEKDIVVNFFIKSGLRELVINDLEFFHINIKKYINYILDYISIKQYGYLDIIYYEKDIPNNFYLILNDSSVGEYTFDIVEESMNFEDYLLYLNNLYYLYEKYKDKKIFYQNINTTNKDEDTLFIDSYLIKKHIEENNKIYSILSYYDVKDAKEIIIKIKMHNFITKKEESNDEENSENNDKNKNNDDDNSKKYREEILQIHKTYKADPSVTNYDKVINGEISYEKYFSTLSNLILTDKSYQHYFKLLNNPNKNIIKKLNYQKQKTYKKLEYFGNFEYSPKNKNTIKRELTTRSETNSTLVLCFNKSVYCSIIASILKEENEKNIFYFHEEYIFKDVNMEYFTKKIFTDFELNCNYKGDILFNQNQGVNKIILLKEGIIELQMRNISLSELGNKITSIKELLIKKIREYKITQNHLLDKVLELEMNKKSNLQINFIKEIYNKKLNITFSRCNKGFFGEYECFFDIPCLLTGVVVSENCEEYIYPFKKFTELNYHSITLNEKLKDYSFNKLINILKRMFNIYNSYWRILNNQYSNMIKEDQNNNNINLNENNKSNLYNNNFNELNVNKINNNNNDDNYYKIESYASKNNKLDNNFDIVRLKMSTPLTSQTLFCGKLKEVINNNIDTIKNERSIIKNKINQTISKNGKKYKIKWDFSFTPNNNFQSVNTERSKSINLSNNSFIKKKEKTLNKNKKNKKALFDVTKSSLLSNNYIQIKLNETNEIDKSKKSDKKVINNIILPPILKENERKMNIVNISKHSSLKSYELKSHNVNFDNYFNNEYKHNFEKNYLFSDLTDEIRTKKNNNFNVKKVSINFLKSRKKKYILNTNNNESNNSFGENYLTNE